MECIERRVMLNISVVVATKDRGPAIDETIDSLLGQDLPPYRYEIIVVDNRSTAENRRYLQKFCESDPDRLHYVREEKLGLSNARNCGIEASRFEIIAFIDDDAVAPPHWLTNILRPFETEPTVFSVGSKVLARFSTPPPDWIDERLGGYISNFDRGDKPVRLKYNEYPRGVNMAFRRSAFTECGQFLDCFGRKGDSMMSYEEIELCYRVEKAGYTVLYVPDAEVHHLIRGDRLNRAWFLKRFYWQGRSEGLFELIHFGRRHALGQLWRHAIEILRAEQFDRRHHIGYIASVVRHLVRPPSC